MSVVTGFSMALPLARFFNPASCQTLSAARLT
jgi:hypothetical protein